jgi:DNA-binding transcriptional ArsR family regulator
MRDMNRSSWGPVNLLPIFRSATQYRLVGELFTNPGREVPVGELAALVDASHATVSREVTRLERAGLVATRQRGRQRLVAAADSPVLRPLRDLMSIVYGVPAVIRDEFAQLGGRAEIFGSWAARWFGEPGPIPNDVDVLVVGDVDPTDAWDAAARATRRLGIEVNVVVRTPEEWRDEDTGFARAVAAGPRIAIADSADPSTAPLRQP